MTVTLRTPENLPELNLNTKVSVRRAMNGDLWGYKGDSETYRQTLEIKLFNCTGLSSRSDFITFLESIGQDSFTYIDPDGVSWTVRLINDPTRIIDAARSYHRVSLTIEGTEDG